ncbi:MAG TPA: tRNA1(Val) (adenine(37)-N6)-methyltransferase [Geobacteraceae bacterium]|nr:tRNA1(Val) (adenine(37)-N6)-methyltransferase [Geobacteraceae bacterium]
MTGSAETIDLLRSHDLRIIQPKRGYRFSLDPIILCDFARPAGGRIADLGCGCGIIPLLMARLAPHGRITGVELQPAMAGLARRNVEFNGLVERVDILESDILHLGEMLPANSFDLVLANPPYRRRGEGRISPWAGRDLARHESSATLEDFLAAAKRLVRPGGRICFIYHPERLVELLHLAHAVRLAPRRLRMVHGDATAPARMFMVEMMKGSRGGLEVLPPLLVYDAGGYTPEMLRIYGDEGSAGRLFR